MNMIAIIHRVNKGKRRIYDRRRVAPNWGKVIAIVDVAEFWLRRFWERFMTVFEYSMT